MTELSTATAEGWHGFPRLLGRELAIGIRDILARIWNQQGGSGPNTEPGLTRWFDPVARGARLRDQLAALAETPAISEREKSLGLGEFVRPPFVLPIDGDRFLLTPEGLQLLLLLEIRTHDAADQIVMSWADTDAADRASMEFYRAQSTKRLMSVIRLQRGDGPPMLPASIGLVLLLILNGNTSPKHGLARPTEPALLEVDQAMAEITRAFVDTLDAGGGRRRSVSDAAFSLYSGYALTEARRRLGSDLTVDPIRIAEGAADRVIDRIAADLARRPNVSDETVRLAVERLGEAYDRHRPVLASYGLAHGRPGRGAELARDVVHALQRHRDTGGRADG